MSLTVGDNLPNTGLETHACGIPAAAFIKGGLFGIVDDHDTGVLAEPCEPAILVAERVAKLTVLLVSIARHLPAHHDSAVPGYELEIKAPTTLR